jgi:hypothetical protein
MLIALVAPRSNGGINFGFAMASALAVPLAGIAAAFIITCTLNQSRGKRNWTGAILAIVFTVASGFIAFLGCAAISESGGR